MREPYGESHLRHALSIAVLLLTATPSLAQSLCIEPSGPMPVDGATVSADQMRGAMSDARNFIAQSGVYQDCLAKEADAAKTQATADGQPLDPAIETGNKARIAASQKAQERVGNSINASLTAYKKAHSN